MTTDNLIDLIELLTEDEDIELDSRLEDGQALVSDGMEGTPNLRHLF